MIKFLKNQLVNNPISQIAEYWLGQSKIHEDRCVPSVPSRQDIEHYEDVIKKLKPNRTLILGATPELRDLAAKYSQESVVADITFEAITGFLKFAKFVDPLKEIWVRANWLNLPFPDKYFDCIIGDLVLNQLDTKDHTHFLMAIKRFLSKNGIFVMRCTFSNPKYENQDTKLIIGETLRNYKNHPRLGLELLSWRLQSRFVDSNKKMDISAIDRCLDEYNNLHASNDYPDISFITKSNRLPWTQLAKNELLVLLGQSFLINAVFVSNDYEDGGAFPVIIMKHKK